MEWLRNVPDLVVIVTGWLAALVAKFPVVATVLGLTGALLGAWGNYKSRRATIFGHSMQAITHLDSRWESYELRESKRIAAGYLHRYHTAASPRCVQYSQTEETALTAVLNFLEVVGAFVKAGAVSERIAWQLFGSAAQHYVEAAEWQLTVYRHPHKTVFSELHYLYLISRVEEDRLDLPLAWLWRRSTAVALTWRSRRSLVRDSILLPAVMCYAAVFGRVQPSRSLPKLFTRPELIQTLARDAFTQLGDTASKAVR